MWMKTLAMLLIAGSLSGQERPIKSLQEPCPQGNATPTGPGLTVNERHEQLRRGREEDFAIVLCSPQLPYGGCGAQPHPPQTGIVPITFAMDVPKGLAIWYRDGRKYRPLVPGAPVSFHRGSKVLLLRMRAADSLPLGIQTLHGSLTFQNMKPGEATESRQITVDFQVGVAEHDAKVGENDWPFGSQVGRHAKDVALAPLVPFEYLLFIIVCGISTCDI